MAPTSLVRSRKPCSYVALSGENTSEAIAFLSVISVLGSRTLIGWPMVLNSQSTTASTHGQLLLPGNILSSQRSDSMTQKVCSLFWPLAIHITQDLIVILIQRRLEQIAVKRVIRLSTSQKMITSIQFQHSQSQKNHLWFRDTGCYKNFLLIGIHGKMRIYNSPKPPPNCLYISYIF